MNRRSLFRRSLAASAVPLVAPVALLAARAARVLESGRHSFTPLPRLPASFSLARATSFDIGHKLGHKLLSVDTDLRVVQLATRAGGRVLLRQWGWSA